MTSYTTVLRRLRSIKTPYEITVRMVEPRVVGKRNYGDTVYLGKHRLVRISSELGEEQRRDTLVHEWSHAIGKASDANHGPKWGRLYAKCYCVAFKTA